MKKGAEKEERKDELTVPHCTFSAAHAPWLRVGKRQREAAPAHYEAQALGRQ